MLAQLVCLDRRYQRMNCFNMRELQALLKEKYFSDLVNNYDYRSNIFNTVNLRYKLNDLSSIDNNLPLFINNSLKLTFFVKIQNFNKSSLDTEPTFANFNYLILTNYDYLMSLKQSIFLNIKNTFFYFLRTPHLRNLFEVSMEQVFGTFLNVFEVIFFNTKYMFISFFYNMQILVVGLLLNNQLAFNFYFQVIINNLLLDNVIYTSFKELLASRSNLINHLFTTKSDTLVVKFENKTPLNDAVYFNNSIGESVEDSRALRFSNPVFKYDYKLGNYLSKETILGFPHLMLSQTQVTGGIRKSSYIYSAHFIELLKANISNYLTLFNRNISTPLLAEPAMRHSSVTNGFYSLFLKYYSQSDFINTH